ncbi:MAG TPA: septum formation initiator family protein [Pyrinomonadaceae bacterium]
MRPQSVKREKANSWLGFAVVVALSSMICLTVNLRAYSELSAEINQHQILNTEVNQLTTENSALQDEIQQIKTDKTMIEREARRLGMSRPNEKVLVPAN